LFSPEACKEFNSRITALATFESEKDSHRMPGILLSVKLLMISWDDQNI